MNKQFFSKLLLLIAVYILPAFSIAKALIDTQIINKDGTTLEVRLRNTDFLEKQTLASMSMQIGDDTFTAKLLKP